MGQQQEAPLPHAGVTPHSSLGLSSGEKRGNWMLVMGQTTEWLFFEGEGGDLKSGGWSGPSPRQHWLLTRRKF